MTDFHPAANIFPMMTGKDYADLVTSIKKNGQRIPILLFEEKILDGRNRYAACLELKIEPKYERWDGGNPWEYVWDANAERRHLTEFQKALIKAEQLEGQAEWLAEREARHEREEKRNESGRFAPLLSNDKSGWEHEALASEAGVSSATAGRAMALRNARPDLAEKVKIGEMKPSEAMRQRKRDEYAEKAPTLPNGKYRVIYADPPWSYGNTQPDYHGVQDDHYPIMSLKDICAMPVPEMTEDNAVLFLWVTSPILEEAFRVVEAWGFEYKASFVWDKIKHNMGHYNSVRHELLLVCVRGSCQPDERKLFDSVVSEERTNHSQKPETFRQIIDTIYLHGKRIELFARTKVDGWDVYGNEASLS
jgi:N6-adenosine-specific RNA methylase IME4